MVSIQVTALSGTEDEPKKRRGESNLVQRLDGYSQELLQTAAIDAGNNSRSQIAKVLCDRNLQILILTHDDDDHIKGAEFVLQKSSQPVKELWIPAFWMMQKKILDDIDRQDELGDERTGEIKDALDFGQVVASSEGDCFLSSSYDKIFDFAEINDQPSDESEPQREGDGREVQHEILAAESRRIFSQKDDYSRFEDGVGGAMERFRTGNVNIWQMMTSRSSGRSRHDSTKRSNDIGEMARRTRKRIDKIDRIIRAARARGTAVRCFLPAIGSPYGAANLKVRPSWEYSGEAGFLTIINAVEVVILKPRITDRTARYMTLVALAGLSQQNRCALVSFVWPTLNQSKDGFVVWSDSSGEWQRLPRFRVPWELVGGMTAPHHGSDNIVHQQIWAEVKGNAGDLKVVVSGDLSEDSKPGSKADAIKSVIKSNNIMQYGVVHCLVPAGNRCPRADVIYHSRSSNLCAFCYPNLCTNGRQISTTTGLFLYSLVSKCSSSCKVCNSDFGHPLPRIVRPRR